MRSMSRRSTRSSLIGHLRPLATTLSKPLITDNLGSLDVSLSHLLLSSSPAERPIHIAQAQRHTSRCVGFWHCSALTDRSLRLTRVTGSSSSFTLVWTALPTVGLMLRACGYRTSYSAVSLPPLPILESITSLASWLTRPDLTPSPRTLPTRHQRPLPLRCPTPPFPGRQHPRHSQRGDLRLRSPPLPLPRLPLCRTFGFRTRRRALFAIWPILPLSPPGRVQLGHLR